MSPRWGAILVIPLLVSLVLLLASQAVFLHASLYEDLGYGKLGESVTLANYVKVLGDSFFLAALGLTVQLSAAAALVIVAFGFPLAYVLARMRSRWVGILLGLVLLSSFVSIVIKVYGIEILFAGDGVINSLLLASGVLSEPTTIIGTRFGVVLGLVYFGFGFGVLLLYAVVRAIPRSLEDAAASLGTPRRRVFLRVILPLSAPGLVAVFLISFNLCMGAFTSAALLGGGRILTVPVLIQRAVLQEVRYGQAGVLAALLIVTAVAVNLGSIAALRQIRSTRAIA